MDRNESIRTLESFIYSHYGRKGQMLKLCEECAELIQAVLKGELIHIVEEMADVQILIDQLREGLKADSLMDSFEEMKLVRQITRIGASDRSGSVVIPDRVWEAVYTLGNAVSGQSSGGSQGDAPAEGPEKER